MTIALEINYNNPQQQSNNSSAITNNKNNKSSSKPSKEIKIKTKNEKKTSKKLSSNSSLSTTTTSASASPTSIKDSLIDNKEKLNDLNDQILNSQQIHYHRHHHHHSRPSDEENRQETNNQRNRTNNNITTTTRQDSCSSADYQSNYNPSHHKSESIMSSDSDIRFTRKKLGDNQRCGFLFIAGFLIILLVAGLILYAGYIFLQTRPMPNRIFRGRFRVIEGDRFISNYTDQNSDEFLEKSRDYRERINLLISRSPYRKYYDGCEILALDGQIVDETRLKNNDLIVHFLLNFDPLTEKSYVTVEELKKLFVKEFENAQSQRGGKFFRSLKVDMNDFQLKEIIFGKLDDLYGMASYPLENGDKSDQSSDSIEIKVLPPRTCQPIKLSFCNQIGYNTTTYPNLLGHNSYDELEKDLISFRELVDSECFLQAYDFLCHLLQPSCEWNFDSKNNKIEINPRYVCRSYCQSFLDGCASRIPDKFKQFFDCEKFPEQSSMQSCHNKPACLSNLKAIGFGNRVCDGIGDCPNLEDEVACSYCPANALYCGRGRSCVKREMRCDGKFDCPDGSDEKDCLSIAPLVQHLINPKPLIPHRRQFYHEGFAVFTEKGQTGKLCAEGMETNSFVRSTVAESLCKALGYEKVIFAEVRNDSESNQNNYVRVLDPRASEISFVRTTCARKEAFYLACSHLECGKQSAISSNFQLPKMASPGDWPFHVALFRKNIHVCDGTLISAYWVLTTISCFQGQPKATWMASFGNVRIGAETPWTQRRRIVGMVKSPVEGSTAALVRLQNPVIYTDFVRPICLPDYANARNAPIVDYQISSPFVSNDQPHAEKYAGKIEKTFTEDQQFFKLSDREDAKPDEKSFNDFLKSEPAEEDMSNIKAEPQLSQRSVSYYTDKNVSNSPPPQINNQWTQCTTLGWSRQKEHLQRVQLKLIDMKACENISITTVNSICAEATYHKQDCNEEEFAGSPILCLLPDEKRWALVGVASWRIACTHSGTERPRMYDKIETNSAWIREIINAPL